MTENTTQLMNAALEGDLEKIRSLINSGVDVNERNKFGDTALHVATFNSKIDAIKTLLECGADVNLKDSDGDTPLHWAVGGPCTPEIVDTFLDKGAEVNTCNGINETPLHFAARALQLVNLKSLLSCGADKTLKNSSGQTPKQVAKESGRSEFLEYL